MGKTRGQNCKLKKPLWIKKAELTSTDLYRSKVLLNRHTERIGTLQELGPPEELGRRLDANRLAEVIVENKLVTSEALAKKRVAKVMQSVSDFLSKRMKAGTNLGTDLEEQVIISCLVDCVKSSRKLSLREIEARRHLRDIGKYKKNDDAKTPTRFRNELMSIIIYNTSEPDDSLPDLMGIMEASEWAANWVIGLGCNLGNKEVSGKRSASQQPQSFRDSETRYGLQIARAAASIRKSFGNYRRKKEKAKLISH